MAPVSPESEEFQSIVMDILAPLRPAAIYLFGSLATGTEHPASDVDLAFLPTSPADPAFCFDLSNRLADRLGREVDLVDLGRASTVLAKEVLRCGKIIHLADQISRRDFEMRTLSDYARLNEERKDILALES